MVPLLYVVYSCMYKLNQFQWLIFSLYLWRVKDKFWLFNCFWQGGKQILYNGNSSLVVESTKLKSFVSKLFQVIGAITFFSNFNFMFGSQYVFSSLYNTFMQMKCWNVSTWVDVSLLISKHRFELDAYVAQVSSWWLFCLLIILSFS